MSDTFDPLDPAAPRAITQTVISRATWVDDDGSGTTGTVINNARLQGDVYDKIDALYTSSPGWQVNDAAAGMVFTKSNATLYAGAYDAILDLIANYGPNDSCMIKFRSSSTHNCFGIKKGGNALVLTVNVTGVPVDALSIPSSGHLVIPELAGDISASNLPSGAACAVYMKNDKIVFARNNAGVIQFLRCNLDGSTVTWVQNTTAP